MISATATISAEEAGTKEPRERHQAGLFLALECERPMAGPARYLLGDVQEVSIGRGLARRARLEGSGTARRLELTLPDPRVSTVHLRIRRAGGGWELSDAGAKNGTVVNGGKVESRLLADRDLIEIGRTFIWFRRDVRALDSAPPVVDADAIESPQPGLSTLLPALEADFGRLRSVAVSDLTISIQGESGTGKELVATAVHKLSGRSGPFLALNCGALPANLVASELFGYRKGAFSGAEEDRPGLFRSAEKGTLFLDEIGELPPESQVALLRVLQEGEVLPVGDTRPMPVDVRVVCASSRDLGALAEQGRLRRDLFERLAGYTVTLPPLRERVEDIGLIAVALLRKLSPRGAGPVALGADAARALLRYAWPGNVRELENCLHAALLLASSGRIELAHLAPGPRLSLRGRRDGEARSALQLTEDQIKQRDELAALLADNGGNVSAVARRMGKDRVQIQRWLRRLDLDARTFRR